MRKMLIGLIGATAVLCSSVAMAQSARDIRGPAPVVPLASEPAPKIIIDAPLADSLAQGRVVIQYRAEDLRIVPVFGPAALDVSPRIGHIHVTVDDAPWRWASGSASPNPKRSARFVVRARPGTRFANAVRAGVTGPALYGSDSGLDLSRREPEHG